MPKSVGEGDSSGRSVWRYRSGECSLPAARGVGDRAGPWRAPLGEAPPGEVVASNPASILILHVCTSCVRAQLHPALSNPVDCSPPDSSGNGIIQTRILEWVPISYSGGLPHSGIEPPPVLPALAGWFFSTVPPGKPCLYATWLKISKIHREKCRFAFWEFLEEPQLLSPWMCSCRSVGTCWAFN